MLSLRGTFINLGDGRESKKEPRSQSAPPGPRDMYQTEFFKNECSYVSQLMERSNSIRTMSQAMSKSTGSNHSDKSEENSDEQAISSDSGVASTATATRPGATKDRVLTSGSSESFEGPPGQKSQMKREDMMKKTQMKREDLMKLMANKKNRNKKPALQFGSTAQFQEDPGSPSCPVSRALEVIQELPNQLDEALHQNTMSIVGNVQSHVIELCREIRNSSSEDSAATAQALRQIAGIPEMVMSTLKSRASEMSESIMDHLETIVASAMENENDKADLAKQIAKLPMQVERITGKALGNSEPCPKEAALRHMDSAMARLPESQALADSYHRVASSVPSATPQSMVYAASQATSATVHMAVAGLHATQGSQQGVVVENKVVADMILRAKVEGEFMAQHGPALYQSQAGRLQGLGSEANSGSQGHPELCTRPCLYFGTGKCANGNSCDFCHLPHPKRPAHLDKRNRALLKSLPPDVRAAMLKDALLARSRALRVDISSKDLLNQLEQVGGGAPLSAESTEMQARNHRLASALRTMTLSTLLAFASRINSEDDADEGDSMEVDAQGQRKLHDRLAVLRAKLSLRSSLQSGSIGPGSQRSGDRNGVQNWEM
ncbi:unnamed protein product [Polarella glacialis]|uniref:C3H1-type domain-containing protein n=1 Tax=Polarella glacialis TaxID=89957 RepID=A0A813JCT0_POLGL|nr:unnamed protein product [Polarella glacialis]